MQEPRSVQSNMTVGVVSFLAMEAPKRLNTGDPTSSLVSNTFRLTSSLLMDAMEHRIMRGFVRSRCYPVSRATGIGGR